MNKYDYSSKNTSDSEKPDEGPGEEFDEEPGEEFDEEPDEGPGEEHGEEFDEEYNEEPDEEPGEEPGEGEKYCMCSCGNMICRNICSIQDIICHECTYSNNFYILENRETHFRIVYTHLGLELIESSGHSSASLLLQELASDYIEFKYLLENHRAIAIQVIQNELDMLYS